MKLSKVSMKAIFISRSVNESANEAPLSNFESKSDFIWFALMVNVEGKKWWKIMSEQTFIFLLFLLKSVDCKWTCGNITVPLHYEK